MLVPCASCLPLADWIGGPGQTSHPLGIYSWLLSIVGGIGLCAGLYSFIRGFQLLSWKRRIEDTPITNIAAAAAGEIKVFGKAAGSYTITETLFTPLFVQDETGSLMIDPRGALLDLAPEYDERVSGNSMGESSRRFLHRHGLTEVGETAVTEYTLKPGDPMLVLGCLSENTGLSTLSASS